MAVTPSDLTGKAFDILINHEKALLDFAGIDDEDSLRVLRLYRTLGSAAETGGFGHVRRALIELAHHRPKGILVGEFDYYVEEYFAAYRSLRLDDPEGLFFRIKEVVVDLAQESQKNGGKNQVADLRVFATTVINSACEVVGKRKSEVYSWLSGVAQEEFDRTVVGLAFSLSIVKIDECRKKIEEYWTARKAKEDREYQEYLKLIEKAKNGQP